MDWKMFAIVVICVIASVLGNNDPEFITDTYPVSRQFNESWGTASGVALFSFTASDPEGVTPVLSYTYDPANTTLTLEITETTSAGQRTGTVLLRVGKEFDYETQSTYKIYANAFDGVSYAGNVLLTLEVLDLGETPTLDPATTTQNFTIVESPTGTLIGHPAFNISDGDEFETHTWNITGGTGVSYINIYSNNGTLILMTDYDLELAGIPTNVYVDVDIVDKYGLSVTVTFSLSVTDTNDNFPIFNPTTYSFEVNQTLAVGTVMATLNASDADVSSPNNAITYSLNSSSSITDYFIVDGQDVKIQYTIYIVYGSGPYIFYAHATDGGDPALTATATLTVTIPAATTTPTTTTSVPPAGYDWNGSSSNVALLIAACMVAALLLGYVLVLCWRWHTFGKCLPTKCPSSQDCNKCCECCHDKDDGEKLNPDEFGPTFTIPPKKGMDLLSPSSNVSMKSTPVKRF